MWFKKRLNKQEKPVNLLRIERNRRYYERHRDEILKKRRESYQESQYL